MAERELKDLWPLLQKTYPKICTTNLKKIITHKGGLEISVGEAEGWILNHYLKVPTRILQRLDHFTAKDFPKLFKKLQGFEWQKYLRQGDVDIVVSTYRSRLKMKNRIAESVQKAVAAANERQKLRKPFLKVSQTIFVRIENDVVTISIDTSGESLHRRGYKLMTVEAPMRETLAAGSLRWMLTALSPLPDRVIFTDPTCGSGTLVLELAALYMPPRLRHFAYRNFPHAGEILPENKWTSLAALSKNWSFEGFDISEAAVQAATKNAEKLGVEKRCHFEARDLTAGASLGNGDFRVIMMNPPYGERLKSREPEALVRAAIETYDPIALLVILPSSLKRPVLSSDYKWHNAELNTLNGGIGVTIRLAMRR